MFICRLFPEEGMSQMLQTWRMSRSYESAATAAACSASLHATLSFDPPISGPSESEPLPDSRFPYGGVVFGLLLCFDCRLF